MAEADHPDDELSPEVYRRLNERFYHSSPATYFEHRLDNLLEVAARTEAFGAKLREGFSIAGCKMSVEEPVEEPSEDQTAVAHFVTAETEILLHHVAEALLRLYVAHEEIPPCPWIEISRIRRPGKFNAMLRRRFVEPVRPGKLERLLAPVFFGVRDLPEGSATSREAWETGVANVLAFLRHFANEFLRRANLYNAVKHGFAVNPDAATFTISHDESGSQVLGHGPSIEYLERTKQDDGAVHVNQTIAWRNLPETWAFCSAALSLIENIWAVGKMRYLDEPAGTICLFEESGPAEFEKDARRLFPTGSMNTLRIPIGIETLYPGPGN